MKSVEEQRKELMKAKEELLNNSDNFNRRYRMVNNYYDSVDTAFKKKNRINITDYFFDSILNKNIDSDSKTYKKM